MTAGLILNHVLFPNVTANTTLTIPAATAGSKMVLTSVGNGIVAATGWTKRTTYPSGNQLDLSLSEKDAAGGETSITVTASGNNDLEYYEMAAGLTFVAAGNPPASNTTHTDPNIDNVILNQNAVTLASGQGVIFSLFAARTATAFGETGAGTVKWYQHGPYAGTQPNGGNAIGVDKFVWKRGVADVDATHSYPETNAAGVYQCGSVWFEGGDNVWAAQVLYANTSGKTANPPAANPIVEENSLPGTLATHWFLGAHATDSATAAGSGTIAAFTDKPAYQPGDTVEFFVDTPAAAARLEIYRTGFYGYASIGARNVLGVAAGYIPVAQTTQPAPSVDTDHGTTVCDAWTSNASWTIPTDACPGVYTFIARRTDVTTHAFQYVFVVEGNLSGHVFLRSSLTDGAYDCWGATTDSGVDLATGVWTGRSLYQSGQSGATSDFTTRGTAVSYQHPRAVASMRDMTQYFDAENGEVMFMEAQGINLGYLNDTSLETAFGGDPTALDECSSVIVAGHVEYVTTDMYDAILRVRDVAKKPTWYMSANTFLWRVRYDATADLWVCCKDSGTRDVGAPAVGTGYDTPPFVTGAWRDGHPTGPLGDIPNPDQRFEAAATGQRFVWSGPINAPQAIDAAHKSVPVWRNSAAVQALATGTTLTSAVNDLGYEADSPNNSFGAPMNRVLLFEQSLTSSHGSNNDGTEYDTNTTDVYGWSVYRAASGAPVLNTGWRGLWLCSFRQGTSTFQAGSISLDIQNAMLCLLWDFLRATPETLQALRSDADTAPTDPRTNGFATVNDAMSAYGLSVPASHPGGMFFVM